MIAGRAILERLEERGRKKFPSGEFRLSEMGACPRMRVARTLGFREEPPSLQQLGVFEAGHVWEAWLAERLRARHPNLLQQVEVKHKWGVGHIDMLVVVPEERTGIECKTTTLKRVEDLPEERHLLQAQAYMHFWGRRHGVVRWELVYILKESIVTEDGRPVVFPVEYSPKVGEEIERELEELAGYRERGELPPVPEGYSPFGYPCKTCPFRVSAACFPPEGPPARLDGSAAELFRKYALLRRERQRLEEFLEAIRERQKRMEREIGERMEAEGLAVAEAGGVRIRRTWVAGRTWYEWRKAEKAGVDLSRLEPFRHEGEGYWRYTVSDAHGG